VLEGWRQVVDAPFGAPFYLITSKDPSSTGDNSYEANDPSDATGYVNGVDNFADTTLTSKEANPENGGLTLASMDPPPASIIASTQDRILLAGIPGNPYRIVYSRLRGKGEIASFNDTLFVDLPADGGAITAIGFMNESLIVFKESATFLLPGDGYDNSGAGQNYGPGRILSADVGAESQEAVALTPKGLLFKSAKGWYLLNHGMAAVFVGYGVAEFDAEPVLAIHPMVSQHQVRCVTASRVLVWDYLEQISPWAEWSISGAVSAVLFDDVYHYSDGAEVLAEEGDFTSLAEAQGLDIETGWIKLAGLQGYKSVSRFYLLGEYRGAHDLRVRVAYDYDETDSGPVWADDVTWTVSPTTIGGPLQVEHGPSRPKCEAIKIRITAQAIGVTTAPTNEALKLTGLSLRYGIKPTAYRGLPAAQKQ